MSDKTPEELRKAAVQAERDSIAVENNKTNNQNDEKDEKEVIASKSHEAKADNEGDDTGDEDKGDESNDSDHSETDVKDEIEKVEKTEEDLEKEKLEAKSAAEKARVQKRIDKEVAKRKTLETELADLKKQLAAKSAEGENKFTEEDIKAEAKRIAQEQINERDFTNACNRLASSAQKLDKDFDKKMQNLAEEVAPIPGYMIGILDDLDNGGAVLKHFTENADVYEDIIALAAPKMAVAVTKLAAKLEAEAKPKLKANSKVPPPIDPVKGQPKQSIVLRDDEPMEDWIAKRNKAVAERQASKRAGMR